MDKAKDLTSTADMISVDQFKSLMLGLIAQMKGLLTTKKYQQATVYVDQALRLSYVYPQTTALAEDTLKGK